MSTLARTVTQLSNALVAAELDDEAGLREIVWGARALVRKSQKDIPSLITLARALSYLGERAEALKWARAAYQLRSTAIDWLPDIGAVLISLGQASEAQEVCRTVLRIRAHRASLVPLNVAAITGVISGSIDLLREVADAESETSFVLAQPILDIIVKSGLDTHFSSHMSIILNSVLEYLCKVNVSFDNIEAVHASCVTARYWVNCDFRTMLTLRRLIDERLRDFYIAAGIPELPYLNNLTHSLSTDSGHPGSGRMTTPTDLLTEARTLQTSSRTNETRRRTVVGRAYYATFHAVLDAASSKGYRYEYTTAKTGRHEDLIRWAQIFNHDADLRAAGSLLSDLKTFRRIADYVLDHPFPHPDMIDCVEKATYVVQDLLG